MMHEYLEKFQDRMQFIAVIHSIVNRKNTNLELEALFKEHELDNIIISVLVFIMEKTLTEDSECSLEDIGLYLRGILPDYNVYLSIEETERLTRYLIKDILQNKDERRTYGIMDYGKGMTSMNIRLIADSINDKRKITYRLTDQGYNFMFRTKEIDEELSFTIEELKLKLLIKNKNYKKGISQSKELIRMLVNKRNDLKQFETKYGRISSEQ